MRVAAGEEAAGWRDALSAPGVLDGAKVLKEDEGSWVRRARVMGRDVVVKCRVLNTVGRRVKHALRMGHGMKHWRGAERLMRAGIATGRPLALVRCEVDGKACEVLVLEWVEGKTLLEILDEIARGVGPGVREQHRIARAVGIAVRVFLEAELLNEDPKPSNLIVLTSGGGHIGLGVIDTVAIQKRRRMNLHDIETYETLQSLMIEPIGCGCPPRRTLWMRALHSLVQKRASERILRHTELRGLITEVGDGIRRHGDPRPRVDPLGGSRGTVAPPGLGSSGE
jgi:predicted thioesterase